MFLLSNIVNMQIIQRFDGELLQQRGSGLHWEILRGFIQFRGSTVDNPQGQTERWDRKIERIRIFSTDRTTTMLSY